MKVNPKSTQHSSSISVTKHILPLVVVVGVLIVAFQSLGDNSADNKSATTNLRSNGNGSGAAASITNSAVLSTPLPETGSKRFIMEISNLKEGAAQSTGIVILETRPSWAPIGVQHFHELVQSKFYDQCRFFRVVPNFIVQFGINADPEVQKKWRNNPLKDDPVTETNKRGTLTFATAGPNTRTVQLFINTKDNSFLDGQGFSPFATVLEGMEFVDQINDQYGEKPDQGQIQSKGNEYLNKGFPKLSFIVTMYEHESSRR